MREAARLATEEIGLRAVARQIGISAMGLSNFLEGAQPYKPTLRKLTHWYAEFGARRGASEHTVRAALDILLEGLPQKTRGRGRGTLLAAVDRLHRDARTQPPAWLGRMRGDEGGEAAGG
jgi:hypothetical protein